jgi:DNA-binding NarL/FixJ family response regulator
VATGLPRPGVVMLAPGILRLATPLSVSPWDGAGRPGADRPAPAVAVRSRVGLANRDTDVLASLANGGGNRGIARALLIGEHTVAVHLRCLCQAWGA